MELPGLVIERDLRFVNAVRNYRVMVNDAEMGKIENGETVRIPLEPGEYEVHLIIDWCRSNKVAVTIKTVQDLTLRCGCAIRGWHYLNPFSMPYYIFFRRHKYLYLLDKEPVT
ncbi:hypothetical protein SAMN02799624_03392 [Paenibacillus sp. UNC496MF]|nr:hypothetical protein SAMN02799624_03392 [Paenibacillus sp. UNC496MF]